MCDVTVKFDTSHSVTDITLEAPQHHDCDSAPWLTTIPNPYDVTVQQLGHVIITRDDTGVIE
jgi:hypothetical protein